MHAPSKTRHVSVEIKVVSVTEIFINSCARSSRHQMECLSRGSNSSASLLGSAVGRGSRGLGLGLGLTLGLVGLLVSLVGAVDGDLDSDLAALDFLAVHLRDGLLLELLGGKGNEAEAAALAGLTPGLKLLNHEARDGAKSNLRGRRLVSSEKLLKLWKGLACFEA